MASMARWPSVLQSSVLSASILSRIFPRDVRFVSYHSYILLCVIMIFIELKGIERLFYNLKLQCVYEHYPC